MSPGQVYRIPCSKTSRAITGAILVSGLVSAASAVTYTVTLPTDVANKLAERPLTVDSNLLALR